MFQPPRKIVQALSLLESILGVAKNEKDTIIGSILDSKKILPYLETFGLHRHYLSQRYEVDANKTRRGIIGTEGQ